MNLTDEKINANKVRFIQILSEIKVDRPNAKIDDLIRKLESSDFFTAPASVKYHANCKGGLCQHSLNVYDTLVRISERYDFNKISLIIVGLLHDLSKMNMYETAYRNKKVYHDCGSKRDENGTFDWVSEKSYAIIPDEQRFIYGSHEETSEFMVRTFIPLTIEESMAILYHHGGKGWDSSSAASMVLGRCDLAVLLHCADLMSSYTMER